MKGLGNYRFHPKAAPRENIERIPAWLLGYRGDRALVRFHDGTAYSIPADPLKKIGVEPEQRFLLLITRVNGVVREYRVEALAPPRPPRPGSVMPKVVVRDGKKMTTRK